MNGPGPSAGVPVSSRRALAVPFTSIAYQSPVEKKMFRCSSPVPLVPPKTY